jgi:hypothetical protein
VNRRLLELDYKVYKIYNRLLGDLGTNRGAPINTGGRNNLLVMGSVFMEFASLLLTIRLGVWKCGHLEELERMVDVLYRDFLEEAVSL